MRTTGYNLVVKRPVQLVTLLIERLCGNAEMSLEGDLSFIHTQHLPSSSTEPTNLLPRSTIQPDVGFIIVPLECSSKERLIRSILPQAGLRTRIYHIQIQKNGERMFAAYDRFDADCVWLGAWAEEVWLTTLVQADILHSYTRLVEGP